MREWKMTFGCELELADVDRTILIPDELGDWDYTECDIVNTLPPYRGIAADPLGVEPPVGGEIHVPPATSPEGMGENARRLLEFLRSRGTPFVASPSSPFHVHVRTEGLRDSIRHLKKLVSWIDANQHDVFAKVWGFKKDPTMSREVARYMRTDGAIPMPGWMVQNIIDHAEGFYDFIRLHCCGKDAKSMGRPFRYGFNTYCLKHIDTIEFRFFHSTVDPDQMVRCAELCRQFLVAALGDGKPAAYILGERNWDLPPFVYDRELMHSWVETKHPKSRCRPKRRRLRTL